MRAHLESTAVQGTFFTADELLPYHETLMVRGSKCVIHIERVEGENWRGDKVWISAGFDVSGAEQYGYGGPYDIDTDIPALIAKLKAMIEHGAYEKPAGQQIAEMKAWAIANPEAYEKWAKANPEEYHHWLVRSR